MSVAAVQGAKGKPIFVASPPPSGGKKRHPLKAILSGGIAGGIEICVTFPTEFVKTQLQLEGRAANPRFHSIQSCVRWTYANYGYFGFYRGLSSLLYGSIPKAAVRFGVYEQMRSLLMDENGKLTQSRTLLAGLAAGAAEATLIVCPMETVKVKFINDQMLPKPKYNGFLHGVRSIIASEGMGGVYKGLTATVIKQGSNQAIRFFVHNNITSYMKNGDETMKLPWYKTMVSGMVAGAASVFGNTPVDVVKTKMQGLDAAQYKSTMDCAMTIAREEGFKGFYKGTVPRLGRVCIDVGLVFVLYDYINRVFDHFIPEK